MRAKILIADDERDIVSMLGSFFESKGFRVLPASNGAEALKQVEKQPDIQCHLVIHGVAYLQVHQIPPGISARSSVVLYRGLLLPGKDTAQIQPEGFFQKLR